MKQTIQFWWAGVLGAAVVLSARAQSWEQNLNLNLVAQVQVSSNTVKRVALNSKAIIAMLSGLDSRITNNYDLFLTNTVATPERLPGPPFSSSVVDNGNYVIDVDGGSFTNNVDFTNTVTFTQVSTSPVTYVFNNAVDLGGGLIGYYVPDFPLEMVTAELVDPTGPAYHVSGYTVTENTTPTFSPAAKLLVIEDLNSGFESFVVRDGAKGSSVDTDVSSFMSLSPFNSVSQSRPSGALVYSHIDFTLNNSRGDDFDTQGVATESDSDLKVRGADYGMVRKSLAATLGGSGEMAALPGAAGPMVLSGRLSLSGGKFVPGAE